MTIRRGVSYDYLLRALEHERARGRTLERRVESLEGALRRAYQFSLRPARERDDQAIVEEKQDASV